MLLPLIFLLLPQSQTPTKPYKIKIKESKPQTYTKIQTHIKGREITVANKSLPGQLSQLQSSQQQPEAGVIYVAKCYFTNHITNLHRDDYSIWRPIRSNIKPNTPNHPIRKNSTSPGIWAISDNEKADLFASYLADVFSPHDRGTAPDIEWNWTNLSIHQTHQPSRRTN